MVAILALLFAGLGVAFVMDDSDEDTNRNSPFYDNDDPDEGTGFVSDETIEDALEEIANHEDMFVAARTDPNTMLKSLEEDPNAMTPLDDGKIPDRIFEIEDYGNIQATDEAEYIQLPEDAVEGITDAVFAGGGNDVIIGNSSNNVLFGQDGDDVIYGEGSTATGVGMDQLFGDAGDDIIIGSNGGNLIVGGFGDDYMVGGSGNDEMIDDESDGNVGNDIFDAGGGEDYISVSGGLDHVTTGAGSDTVEVYASEGDTTGAYITDFNVVDDELRIVVEGIENTVLDPSTIALSYEEIETEDGMATLIMPELPPDVSADALSGLGQPYAILLGVTPEEAMNANIGLEFS